MRKLIHFISFLFCFPALVIHLSDHSYANEALNPVHLESAFIYQFCNYIEWNSPPENEAPDFTISVLGKTSIISELKALAETKKIANLPIRILENPEVASAMKSRVLVLGELSSKVQQELKTQKPQILVINLLEGSGRSVSQMSFLLEENKLRFEINRAQLETKAFHLSAQLMKLGKPWK